MAVSSTAFSISSACGRDFALKADAFGRQRLTPGTAEARRVYEVSNGGYTSTGGIVRLRNLILAAPETSLDELIDDDVPTVHPEDRAEDDRWRIDGDAGGETALDEKPETCQ